MGRLRMLILKRDFNFPCIFDELRENSAKTRSMNFQVNATTHLHLVRLYRCPSYSLYCWLLQLPRRYLREIIAVTSNPMEKFSTCLAWSSDSNSTIRQRIYTLFRGCFNSGSRVSASRCRRRLAARLYCVVMIN